jgi:polyhydroxybutyrate depolymerase
MKHPRILYPLLLLMALMLSCRSTFSGTATPAPQAAFTPRTAVVGDQRLNITVGGVAREYVVHVPPQYDGQTPLPVVIMFHGGGGTAEAAMWETGWADKADNEGFLAVLPEGTPPDPSRPARFVGNPQTWNDGSDRGIGAVERNVDDVAFVRQMIDDLSTRFTVDKNRIYATGFSNGASMTFRLGRELPQSFAAIAPVAGADWLAEQRIERPVSLLYITGLADPLNPYEGGEVHIGDKLYGTKPPTTEMILNWAQQIGCPPDSQVLHDEAGVIGIAHGPCLEDSEVALYTVEGLGHHWPGGNSALPESLAGPKSDKLNATDLIWEFFEARSVPAIDE